MDVAASFALHSGHENFDATISEMGARRTGRFCHGERRLTNQLRQLMFGWSGHVESWLEAEADVHVMRYEDMKVTPQKTFTGAVRFAGLDYTEDQIAVALEKARFENLQKMEQNGGFREKTVRSKVFFRKGVVGSWREELNDEQVQRIVNDHGELMRRFGYLSEDGQLTI